MRNTIEKILLLVMLLGSMACSTKPPLPVPADNPVLNIVRDHVDAYQGRPITWGGVILETIAREKTTQITVLAKPLASDAEPLEVDQSMGRFIAVFDGFRDPAIFAAGRKLTVNGIITGRETRKVGEFDYEYVKVNANSAHLWPVPQPSRYDDDYWYDPWYPWYPWYYPYYPRRPAETIKK